MKKNNAILILSIGVIAGSIFGFFRAGISGELSKIISNRYFAHKTYRLIALKLQSPLLKWFLYTLLTSILLFIVVYMIRRSGIAKWVPNPGKNKKRNRIIFTAAAVILIFLLFINITVTVISGPGNRKGPNVLIVVVDALREDTLGISGYTRDTSPNIDEFAKNSVNFKNTYTSSSCCFAVCQE